MLEKNSPKIKKLIPPKLIKFLLVGTSGIALNLIITGLLQQFVFEESYFYLASIIGTLVNLLYNFFLHTFFTFETKQKHKRRFTFFTVYTISLATIQEIIIATITPILGLEYLIVFKAAIVACFAVVTYIFFNFILFKEK
jgi:putative flippase GtrA